MIFTRSPLNYLGNKYKILPNILEILPNNINVFADLFGGSGTVCLNVHAEHIIYNDIVFPIKDILYGIKIIENFDVLHDKIKNVINEYHLDGYNEFGFKKLREDYNAGKKKDWWYLYVLICYSFNSQFRFNSKLEYNSSFGKRDAITEKTYNKLRESYNKLKTLDIIFTSKSFEEFDFSDFDKNDLVYLDPPYYGTTANYNDGKRGFKGWDYSLEMKLRELCVELNNKNIKFVLSNNLSVNTTLEEWVNKNGFIIHEIPNITYESCNYQKKKTKKDREVLICNYIK